MSSVMFKIVEVTGFSIINGLNSYIIHVVLVLKVVCVSRHSLKFIIDNRRLWLIFITFLVAVVFSVAKPKGKYFGCDFQSRLRARISASK